MPFLNVIGFIGEPVDPVVPPTLTAAFLDTDGTGTNGTSFTFSGMSFGTAAANRVLVAAVFGDDSSSGQDASTVTIGGVSATKVVGALDGFISVSLWQALVPTGTSGSVVVTFASTHVTVGVALHSIKTDNQAAQHSSSSTSGSSIAATVPTDGYAIAAYGMHNDNAAITPSNYTEDYDFLPDSGHDFRCEGGHFTASATIDATSGGSGLDEVLVYASWGP